MFALGEPFMQGDTGAFYFYFFNFIYYSWKERENVTH